MFDAERGHREDSILWEEYCQFAVFTYPGDLILPGGGNEYYGQETH
jgi:hypothetical protein